MSDIHALSGAYAVDALDDHERARFEQHLAECGDCRSEVDSLREAAATLPAVTPTMPAPAVRDAVLAGIGTVRPLPPLVTPLAEARRRRRLPALLAAAAAVVTIGVGLSVAQPWDDESDTLSAFDRVVAASDVTEVSLEIDGASATVYHSASLGQAAIETDDLAPAPAGRVYELWLQKDGRMVPAGLMPAGEDLELVFEGDASEATAAGITIEPAGGSEHPTTAPIAVFGFEQET